MTRITVILLSVAVTLGTAVALGTVAAAQDTTPIAHRFIKVAEGPADNLEKLKGMDFEHVIAGHGDPFTGKETIGYFQAFLRDPWRQAKALHEQKVPVAEAAKRIDMTAHKAHFDNFTAPGIPEATAARLYQVLDQR